MRRSELANLSLRRHWSSLSTRRDRYTAGHSAAVAVYALRYREEHWSSRWSSRPARSFVAGLVHDIGKIGLQRQSLGKTRRAQPRGTPRMQRHSEIGERILSNVADLLRRLHPLLDIITRRVDGRGYPDELVGEQIPFFARIFAVADAYNAMTLTGLSRCDAARVARSGSLRPRKLSSTLRFRGVRGDSRRGD